jgi:hypothetical protein
MAHTCNPSYLGGWDQEEYGSRSAQENSLQDLISRTTRAKLTGGVAQVVKHLLYKHKTLSSNPNPTNNNNNNNLSYKCLKEESVFCKTPKM